MSTKTVKVVFTEQFESVTQSNFNDKFVRNRRSYGRRMCHTDQRAWIAGDKNRSLSCSRRYRLVRRAEGLRRALVSQSPIYKILQYNLYLSLCMKHASIDSAWYRHRCVPTIRRTFDRYIRFSLSSFAFWSHHSELILHWMPTRG